MNYLLKILENVKDVTGIDLLTNKSRNRETVDARKIYCYLAKDLNIYSLKEIGQPIGVDHSTIIYHVRECKNLIEIDKAFKSKFEKCELLSPKIDKAHHLKEKYLYHFGKAQDYKKRIKELKL